MWYGTSRVRELIEDWFPESWYRHEKRFEKDLAGFLRDHLPQDTTVRTQGRQRIDIRVGEELGIELKRKLTPTKVDRLIGQIERYDYRDIIVVVCGASENAWELLQERARDYRDSFSGPDVATIRKEKEDFSREERRDQSVADREPAGLFDF